jgi:hypothetical protein
MRRGNTEPGLFLVASRGSFGQTYHAALAQQVEFPLSISDQPLPTLQSRPPPGRFVRSWLSESLGKPVCVSVHQHGSAVVILHFLAEVHLRHLHRSAFRRKLQQRAAGSIG